MQSSELLLNAHATVQVAGLLTTVQDLGRFGYAHLGISSCGAADSVAARIANKLVGNPDNAPVLEVTLLGPTLEFTSHSVVAVTGSSVECMLDEHTVPTWRSFEVAAGSVLRLGSIANQARCYIAVSGELAHQPTLGSYSTDLAAHLGVFGGRPLIAGDTLEWRSGRQHESRRANPEVLAHLYERGPLRITAGPHREFFSPEAVQKLLSQPYIVSHQVNRSGLRLQGEPLPLGDRQLLTEGVPLGAVQVPGDGKPVILFVDQQTTGGYPIIGTIITADLHRVGQLIPNSEVRFAEVTLEEAARALELQQDLLRKVVL
ncbi:MAG TPA: biotin-dependent carboxyltransferase family protein [Candidatus Acidoferrales bacterium]|nr:biotin-dependent carboxyltransferase family protein [Candidatus Acidoferrales bacterium]